MGGEKVAPAGQKLNDPGSPPHGRGKDIQCTNGKQAQRITPAWAGKSDGDWFVEVLSEDHPRMGGEKAAIFRAECGPRGSPPHGRGKD